MPIPECNPSGPIGNHGPAASGRLAASMLLAIFVGWRLARHTGDEVARLADAGTRRPRWR